MKTKHIGIKELRQNLFKVVDDLEKSKRRYVVYRRNKPVLTLDPIDEDAALYTPEAIASIKRGEEDVRQGRVYTLDQVEQHLRAHWARKSTSRRKRKRI